DVHVPLDRGVLTIRGALVIREPGTAAGEQDPHALGDLDLLGIFSVQLGESVPDLVLQPGLPSQVRLALEVLGEGVALLVTKGAGQEAVGTAGDAWDQTS